MSTDQNTVLLDHDFKSTFSSKYVLPIVLEDGEDYSIAVFVD